MEILIVDIETTGFLNKGGKIVEIGIVSLNLLTGEKKILFDEVCHERPITLQEVENCWIVNNSDLTVDQIRNSRKLADMKAEVQAIFDAYPNGTTAFNNSFDFGFLEDRGFSFPRKLACPMKLATDICKLPHPKMSGYKYPNVEQAWFHFFGDTGYIEKHRGADDAFHEADIVHELYKLGVFQV